MAVPDSHSNTQSDFTEEDNPETLFASPEQGTEKKKKRKKKKIDEESNQETQVEVCAKPLVDTVVIPIVEQEENAETITHNSTPKKKKKKKNKNEQSELQLQTCDPISISIGTVEPDVTNVNGDLCAKSLLDTPIPIVPQEEKGEATAQNPNPTPKKKKKKKKQLQMCDPSIPLGVEHDVTMEEGAQQGDDNGNMDLCATHGTAVEELPLPDSLPPEDTPRKKKSSRRKKSAETEAKESNDTDNPQPCSEHEPTVPGINEGCTIPDPTPPEDTLRKKKKKKKVENKGDPLHMDKTLNQTPNLEKKKGAESSEGHSQQPQPCSEHEPTVLGINEDCTLPDPTPPKDTLRKKKKKKKVENQGSPLHMDKTLNQTPNQVEQDPTTPICLQPESLTDQTIPVDPSIPIDTELKMKKRKRKKQRNVLDGEEPNDNKCNIEKPEIPIQTSACLIAAPPIDPAIPVDPCPAIPICPVISTDPEQEMSKKKRKMKRKSEVESEGAEPNEHNSKLPEALPEAPVQESLYPIAAPFIDPTIPAPPIDTATPIDQDEKMTEKKRKKKKRGALISEGAESSEHKGKLPEIPLQSFVYPIVAHSIGPTIPDSAPSIDTATPIDQDQSSSKKKRKRSAPIRKGAEPNEHDGKLRGTPAQGITIAAPSIDPTIPSSQAPPVDQEQMTKKKRKKGRKSELKNQGLESEKHNANLTAETPAQKTEGPTTENSMSMYNAEPPEETLIQRTDSLRVTKAPSKMVCRACRQPGHIYLYCQRLKHLSKNEEVCFFCAEIGHSLGKCSVSRAGGGMFAKCLLCYEHGHFSYNCPRNGHGIDPKVVAANGAINRSVEAEGEPDDDQGRPSSEKEIAKEIL